MFFFKLVLLKFQKNFSSKECFDRRYFALTLTHFSGGGSKNFTQTRINEVFPGILN